MLNIKFGKLLRKNRIEAGKTLKELADYISISESHLCNIESGRRFSLNPMQAVLAQNFLECDDLVEASMKERSKQIKLVKTIIKKPKLAKLIRLARKLDEKYLDRLLVTIKELIDNSITIEVKDIDISGYSSREYEEKYDVMS